MDIVCITAEHYDILTEVIIEGIRCTEHSIKVNNKEFLAEADLILMFLSMERKNEPLLNYIVQNKWEKKTAIIDDEDRLELIEPGAVGVFRIYFKRELYIEDIRKNIKPMPFGAMKAYFKYKGKVDNKYSVICSMATGTNLRRLKIEEAVRSLGIQNSMVGRIGRANACTPSTHELKQIYYKSLAESKIGVSYYGSEYETARFWEIPASGALLLSPPIKIQIPNPPVAGIHFVSYNNEEELKDKIKYYLENEQERALIAKQGYEYVLKYHTSKERAKYLLGVI